MDASSKPPGTPAAPSTSNTTMSDSPPKYVPQFSAATEMILKRINSGAGVGGSLSSIGITGTGAHTPGYEDMRRTVLQGMKTTFDLEITTPAKYNTIPNKLNYSANRRVAPKTNTGSNSGSGTPSNNGSAGRAKAPARGRNARAGQKRKRQRDTSESAEESTAMSGLGGDSESEDTNSVTELPKITQSGRQVVKPTQFVPAATESSSRKRAPNKRTQEQALCKRCGRGHSPQSNMIVFCDGCNLGWHQMCHDPPVSDEEVKDETAPWFCVDCGRKRGIKPVITEMPRGVSWAGKSNEQKRQYLSSLPPQQLVNLLLQVTTLHPNIPIFPGTSSTPNTPFQAYIPPSLQVSNSSFERRTTVYPQQPFPPSATSTAGLFSRAEANPNGPINFIRKLPSNSGSGSGSTPPLFTTSFSPTTSSFPHANSAPPTLPPQQFGTGNNGGDSRESTPPSPPYPKAGQGLMAKLPADEDDIEWLVDDNDFSAFSHSVYDEDGGKMEENGIAVK